MELLIFFFVLSILFSFLCSIWEAVLLSITPSYINTQVKQGSAIGKSLESFKADIDKPLSAILTLNTIAHTVGAIGVGAQAAQVFPNKDLFGISYESIVAVVMTLAILILSEIIPKTIGANRWKSLAPWTVKSLSLLIWLLTPFVAISQLITKGLKKEKDKSVLSRTDFMALADVGKSSGALDENESTIITNLLALGSVKAADVMTPRAMIQSFDESRTLRDFYDQHNNFRFSRIPVFESQQDNVTGLVLKDEILANLVEGRNEMTLKEIKRPLINVHQDDSLTSLYEQLLSGNQHIATVHDHYGTLVGLVTMEDLLETILGQEIVDESDAVADLQALARKRWQERARRKGLLPDSSTE